MLFNKMNSYRIYQVTPLIRESIELWSKRTVWYWDEAIKLSIGINPETSGIADKLSDQDSLEWGTKYLNRAKDAERAMITSELPSFKVKYYLNSQETFIAFTPLIFMSWLHNLDVDYPKELFDVVTQKTLRHAPTAAEEYVFKKKLQAWYIRFKDAELDGIKDGLGMEYILQLLLNRPKSVSVLELQGLVGGIHPQENVVTDSEERSSEGNSIYVTEETRQEVLDDTARRQLEARLETLETDLAFAEESKGDTAQIEEEIEFLKKELSGAKAIFGRDRVFDSACEKNRKSVSNAITNAINNIMSLEATQIPPSNTISEHFKNHIKKGTNCQYVPSAEIDWQL